jgi:uncharacterized RDD family membrane protein YckC
MKCPKCGYLGFEAVDRCRNCGYDFSLVPTLPSASSSSLDLPELPIREVPTEGNPLDDLALIDAASPIRSAGTRVTEFTPDIERLLAPEPRRETRESLSALSLFSSDDEPDEPLITQARAPRAPLAVRRATPDVPRVRSSHARTGMTPGTRASLEARDSMTPLLDLTPSEPDTKRFSPSVTPGARGRAEEWIAPLPSDQPRPATVGSRAAAVLLDLALLLIIDAAVVYFTMEICGLEFADLSILPRGPLAAFLLVQNGGYLVAFTAGGQTLGKMATGIRVVSARSNTPLDLGHAIVRTIVWTVLAVPAGLGFLTAFMSDDRRGLHDRVAGTKVVRASA